MLNRLLTFFAIVFFLSACSTKTPAPVIDRRAPTSVPTAPAPATVPGPIAAAQKPATTVQVVPLKPADTGKTHAVQKGETLYSIALQNNIDHRELALWNNIDNPNVIKVGDIIRLSPPQATSTTGQTTVPVVTPLVVTPQPSAAGERPPANSSTLKTEPRAGKIPYTDQALARLNAEVNTTTPLASTPTTPTAATPATPATTVPANVPTPVPATPAVATKDSIDWAWPVKGKVVTNFTELNKGIDIAGARGSAVNAAAAGTVLHTGAGIRGYGRLVIIKHSTGWVSAYAHNEKIVVMEGQEVKRGQKIAEMGNSDTDQVKLHFEIRRQGKPVDPIGLLPKQ